MIMKPYDYVQNEDFKNALAELFPEQTCYLAFRHRDDRDEVVSLPDAIMVEGNTTTDMIRNVIHADWDDAWPKLSARKSYGIVTSDHNITLDDDGCAEAWSGNCSHVVRSVRSYVTSNADRKFAVITPVGVLIAEPTPAIPETVYPNTQPVDGVNVMIITYDGHEGSDNLWILGSVIAALDLDAHHAAYKEKLLNPPCFASAVDILMSRSGYSGFKLNLSDDTLTPMVDGELTDDVITPQQALIADPLAVLWEYHDLFDIAFMVEVSNGKVITDTLYPKLSMDSDILTDSDAVTYIKETMTFNVESRDSDAIRSFKALSVCSDEFSELFPLVANYASFTAMRVNSRTCTILDYGEIGELSHLHMCGINNVVTFMFGDVRISLERAGRINMTPPTHLVDWAKQTDTLTHAFSDVYVVHENGEPVRINLTSSLHSGCGIILKTGVCVKTKEITLVNRQNNRYRLIPKESVSPAALEKLRAARRAELIAEEEANQRKSRPFRQPRSDMPTPFRSRTRWFSGGRVHRGDGGWAGETLLNNDALHDTVANLTGKLPNRETVYTSIRLERLPNDSVRFLYSTNAEPNYADAGRADKLAALSALLNKRPLVVDENITEPTIVPDVVIINPEVGGITFTGNNELVLSDLRDRWDFIARLPWSSLTIRNNALYVGFENSFEISEFISAWVLQFSGSFKRFTVDAYTGWVLARTQ